jgi:antitoxin CptB
MSERIARLRYQCRRGMLELDAILQPYFEHEFLKLTASEQNTFERLLTCHDPQLFAWLIGSEQPEDKALQAIVTRIKNTPRIKAT